LRGLWTPIIYHGSFAFKYCALKRGWHEIVQRLICPYVCFLSHSCDGPVQNPAAPNTSPGELVDRVGNTGFVQIHAESFRALTPQEQQLAYWLTQAAIAIDPIIYDQLSWFGLRQKRLLEEIVSHPQGIDPATMTKITDYAKLFWGNRGNHNDLTAQKFLPSLRRWN